MRYLFQRIAHNELQWAAPSIGRRGSLADKGYLQKYGFAHEDWNFDKSTTGGFVYGYSYFKPKDTNEKMSIAFATYDKGGVWNLAGYYEDVSFIDSGARFSAELLQKRAHQLSLLRASGDLGGEYENLNLSQIADRLREEAKWYRWRVLPSNVHSLSAAVPVTPALLPANVSRYFTRPTNLTEKAFASLKSIALDVTDKPIRSDYDSGGEVEFPEGKKQQQLHFSRERSAKLVKLAKARFKKKHGHLFCEVCNFDFASKYGQAGVDFIEAHHNIAVSLLPPAATTKVSDLAMVCSNCHRMLHRTRPWRTVAQLRELLKART